MSWGATGAVGETVGALGLLITLIYLASQIRQSSLIGKTAADAEFRAMAQPSIVASLIKRTGWLRWSYDSRRR